MVIEVTANVIREVTVTVMTRTSKLRKRELKFGGKPTTEGQRQWMDLEKTKIDGK